MKCMPHDQALWLESLQILFNLSSISGKYSGWLSMVRSHFIVSLVKSREEVFKSLIHPAWIQECCLEMSLTFFQFLFPMVWVVCCPIMINANAIPVIKSSADIDFVWLKQGGYLPCHHCQIGPSCQLACLVGKGCCQTVSEQTLCSWGDDESMPRDDMCASEWFLRMIKDSVWAYSVDLSNFLLSFLVLLACHFWSVEMSAGSVCLPIDLLSVWKGGCNHWQMSYHSRHCSGSLMLVSHCCGCL